MRKVQRDIVMSAESSRCIIKRVNRQPSNWTRASGLSCMHVDELLLVWTLEKWSLFVDLQGFGGTARSLGIKTGRENDWTRRQLLQPTCWLDLPVWRSESTHTSLTTGTPHSSKTSLWSLEYIVSKILELSGGATEKLHCTIPFWLI